MKQRMIEVEEDLRAAGVEVSTAFRKVDDKQWKDHAEVWVDDLNAYWYQMPRKLLGQVIKAGRPTTFAPNEYYRMVRREFAKRSDQLCVNPVNITNLGADGKVAGGLRGDRDD